MSNTQLDETMKYTKYYRGEYKALLGRKIMDVRAMFPEEMDNMWWDGRKPGAVFILDDGAMFIPMEDEEGNGPGALLVDGSRA
jgi:hypothetical protein